jgi:predicted dehydrogenase
MTTQPRAVLRIGILGAANIARLFVAGVRPSDKVVVTAVAARDVERARKFAAETGVAQVHPTYEALLADPAIDAIYNPLPNNLHAEWSIRALDAGKHVLCEKPLATSGREARAMFDAAARNHVYVAEAYPYRAQPQTLKLRELLRDQRSSSARSASFGFWPMRRTSVSTVARRRRADGRRLLPGQSRAHDCGIAPGARPRDGALERQRRRSLARRVARVRRRAAGADLVQLRDNASSPGVARR